jgi:hypothetical protein
MNDLKLLMKKILPVLFVGVLCSSSVPAQTNPLDLPPSPFSLPASTEPQSAWYLRDATRALELHAASTNAEVKLLLVVIRDMKQKLADSEAEAWRKDPMLLLCDQFIEKTHDWVMEKHQAENVAEAGYFFAVTNQPEAGERRKLENDLSRIMDVILLKELGDNTNFAPLIKSTFDNLEMLRLMDTNSVDTNSAAHPERGYFPYWQQDRLIGYRQTSPPVLTNSFAEIMKEVGKRYDLALAREAQIQRTNNIPPAALAGLKYGYLYRTLDGAAEMYLDCRTPPELQKLREDLRRKLVDLARLDK